jgi:hypothetical protein
MRLPDSKVLKGIILGLLAISIVSIAYAQTGTENTAMPVKEETVQAKVGAGNAGASGVPAGNYFPEFDKIRVDPAYKNLDMKPGDSENFTVTVENRDNKTIKLKPKPLITPYTQNFINESWISISPAEKALNPGEKQEFKVEVNIPKDADAGNYAVLIAFTEKVPEGDVAGYYPNFPGSMQLNINVWIPPNVQILTPYVNDLVEAGKKYTYEVKLRNTGDKDIAISPELTNAGGIIYPGGVSQAFDNSAISIEAPKTVKAGETAIVKLTLNIPADAKGSYSGSLDLNIDDPGFREYEGQVPLSFRILPVLKEPYETTFETKTADPITLEVKAYLYGYGLYNSGENRSLIPSFDVSLKDPAGKEVTPSLVNTKYMGMINIVDNVYPQPYPVPYVSSKIGGSVETSGNKVGYQGNYQGGTTTFVETYTVPGAEGKWTLSILPKNTENFEYTVAIGAAEK